MFVARPCLSLGGIISSPSACVCLQGWIPSLWGCRRLPTSVLAYPCPLLANRDRHPSGADPCCDFAGISARNCTHASCSSISRCHRSVCSRACTCTASSRHLLPCSRPLIVPLSVFDSGHGVCEPVHCGADHQIKLLRRRRPRGLSSSHSPSPAFLHVHGFKLSRLRSDRDPCVPGCVVHRRSRSGR